MADEDQQDAQARLEPPRLFGRKKARKASAPEPASEPEPTPEPEPADVEDTQVIEPEPAPEPAEVDDTTVDPAPTAVEAPPAQSPAPAPPPEKAPPPLFVDEVEPPAVASEPAPEPKRAKARKEPKPPKEPKAPRPPRRPLPGRVAAGLTGLLVGLALVGATAGALRGCEAVQNTPTCGSAGFPLLVAIVVLMVVLGSVLLRMLRVADPGSTSFLAVGLVSVVALLFFIEVIDAWWMIIAIPAVSVAAFLVSHWVTTTFIEPAES